MSAPRPKAAARKRIAALLERLAASAEHKALSPTLGSATWRSERRADAEVLRELVALLRASAA
jgi:hypothetical protein